MIILLFVEVSLVAGTQLVARVTPERLDYQFTMNLLTGHLSPSVIS
jgi:hypothetical protein